MDKKLESIIKVCVSTLLIFYLIFTFNLVLLINTIDNANKYLLILALVLRIFSIIINSILWGTLLSPFTDLPVSKIIKIYLMSYFFNYYTPGGIGGDLFRIHRASNENIKISIAVYSVILERFIGISVSLTLGTTIIMVTDFVNNNVKYFILFVLSLLYFTTFALIINVDILSGLLLRILDARIELCHFDKMVEGFRDCIKLYAHSKLILFKSILISTSFWIITVANIWLIAKSLNVNINITYLFVVIPIITTFAMMPISIQGLGIREALFVYFFARIGVSGEVALSLALISFSYGIIISIFGGILYNIDTDRRLCKK